MKRAIGLLVATLLPTPAAAEDDLASLGNFLWVEADFCTGAQPSLEHLTRLKEEGVRGILNLRRPREHDWAGEQAKAAELGVKYFNIPVASRDPKDLQVTHFLRLTDDPDLRPLFIHCAGAVRVGAFWMIRRVLREGWSVERAEEEATRIGLRPGSRLNGFARDYIARHRDE